MNLSQTNVRVALSWVCDVVTTSSSVAKKATVGFELQTTLMPESHTHKGEGTRVQWLAVRASKAAQPGSRPTAGAMFKIVHEDNSLASCRPSGESCTSNQVDHETLRDDV